MLPNKDSHHCIMRLQLLQERDPYSYTHTHTHTHTHTPEIQLLERVQWEATAALHLAKAERQSVVEQERPSLSLHREGKGV